MVGAGEKILLFRHQNTSEQVLHRLTQHDELQDGDLIEVVIAGRKLMLTLLSYFENLFYF